MTITIYDHKGLIYHHRTNVQRVVRTSNNELKIYYDWDGISFAMETFEPKEFGWYELGDK